MGLLGNALASGISAGANTAAEGFMAQFKSQVEQERQEALIRAQEESGKRMVDYKVGIEDQQRAKVGGLLSSASEGLNSEREILHARINAADKAGYTTESDKMRNRLDRMDDNERAAKKDTWEREHGDKQLAAQEKHYRAIESQAASALSLKKQERQDLNDAMSAYTVADANVKMLDKTADENTIKAAVMARDAAALRLQPYGIKIGADGQGSFHANVVKDSDGNEIVVVTDQKRGGRPDAYKADDLASGGKVGSQLDKWAPPAAAKQQGSAVAGQPQQPSVQTSQSQEPMKAPEVKILSKAGKSGWNVKVDGRYTTMTKEELNKLRIYPDLAPTQSQF